MRNFDDIIAGGGAAGFFTAINIAEANPNIKVAILERGKEVLSKVRISGGGRCNVTHACFVPDDLVKFYPEIGFFGVYLCDEHFESELEKYERKISAQ